jgi:hypothetical protein
MLHITLSCIPTSTFFDMAFKLLLDLKLIIIDFLSNNNFKSHINKCERVRVCIALFKNNYSLNYLNS